MDFINKYKLIINMEEQTVSVFNNDKRIELKLDVNEENRRFPARLINDIHIPPKHTVSVPVMNTFTYVKLYVKCKKKTSFISLYNPTTYSYSLPQGIILGTTTIPKLSFNKNLDIDYELVNKNISNLIQHINDEQHQREIKTVLEQHAKLFDTGRPTIANTLPHEIKTLDHPPPTSKPYYSTPIKQEEMYRITQELLHFELIRPSYSPYAAPALLVAKQDGSWRMVVDYKKLNNITIKDNHPLPNLEQAIQILGGGYRYFSKLDMKSGFWQIPIKEEDKHKTAFITPDGLYEWNVLAQGLKNSPPSFQRVMAEILSPCRQFSLVYIDDIVVYSHSFEEHLKHITQILSILLRHNFQLNPTKCNIFQQEIDYLSHTVSATGVKPNDEKIQAIIKLREPSTLAEANKFLGAILWYRKFIPQFAKIATPIHKITNLTKPNRKKFNWGEEQHQSFLQLKQLLITRPLFLDFPNDHYPVILTTDASKLGISGTLQQIINGETKNLYYHSQVTTSTQRRYDPIELEALAIWLCFQRMRSYLLGRSIIVYTDHCPLCNMMTSTVKNRKVDHISILLQEYNIEKIIHIKGQHNCLADYLSRHPIQYEEELFNVDYGINMLFDGEPSESVYVSVNDPLCVGAVITRSKKKQAFQHQLTPIIQSTSHVNDATSLVSNKVTNELSKTSFPSFTCNFFNIDQVKLEQSKDPVIQKTIKELQQNPSNNLYVLHEDLLYKLMKIHLHNKKKLNDPLGGHFGILRTYLKLKDKFWWPNMKQSIAQYIKSCLPCQQYNISRIKKPGRLCPIDTPDGPFQMIGIDFCGPFMRTPSGNQYVLCITDYFTRWINAFALPNCSAQITAQTIFNEYICRYGVPLSILSDQGTHFKNQLMDAMEKLMGYNHIFSTVYHPQSNGMVERFNAIFVPQLAKLQDRENNNWDEFLSPVIFAYNTGIHSITQHSPFQLQFGREPRLPCDKPPTNYVFYRPNDYYRQLQKSLGIIHTSARTKINSKQLKCKTQYDKHRSDPHYQINDKVLIRVYGSRSKLDPRYSITPKLVIKKQHPIYWVQDEIVNEVTRVHVNDIRPILVI
ncbi:unnamed protein product [Rotaria sp. Silwood2]|nr:unnamed protein product [Rotaria sp. Silwood2]